MSQNDHCHPRQSCPPPPALTPEQKRAHQLTPTFLGLSAYTDTVVQALPTLLRSTATFQFVSSPSTFPTQTLTATLRGKFSWRPVATPTWAFSPTRTFASVPVFPQRNAAFWLAFGFLLSYLSYSSQAHRPRDSMDHSRLSPCASINN